jgi:non-specific serine/threonine protein kinase
VIQHKSFDPDANSLYPAAGDGNLIAPIVLSGDGLALLADFRDNDHKAGIVSKHERSPEAVLKLKWDNRVDIWATATLASYSCKAYKDTKLTAASRYGHSLEPKTSSTEETKTAPSMTVFTLQSWSLYSVLHQGNFRNKMLLGSMFWNRAESWTGKVLMPDRSLESLAAGDFEGQDMDGFLQWIRKALQWNPVDQAMRY